MTSSPSPKISINIVKTLNKVLAILEQAGVTLDLKKCPQLQKMVECLGRIFVPGRLATASNQLHKIKNAVFARSSTQMRPFMCACNMLRRLIEDSFEKVEPTNDYLRKNKELD